MLTERARAVQQRIAIPFGGAFRVLFKDRVGCFRNTTFLNTGKIRKVCAVAFPDGAVGRQHIEKRSQVRGLGQPRRGKAFFYGWSGRGQVGAAEAEFYLESGEKRHIHERVDPFKNFTGLHEQLLHGHGVFSAYKQAIFCVPQRDAKRAELWPQDHLPTLPEVAETQVQTPIVLGHEKSERLTGALQIQTAFGNRFNSAHDVLKT